MSREDFEYLLGKISPFVRNLIPTFLKQYPLVFGY
nr:unnamed protein product [Callosobruchus chinensis]